MLASMHPPPSPSDTTRQLDLLTSQSGTPNQSNLVSHSYYSTESDDYDHMNRASMTRSHNLLYDVALYLSLVTSILFFLTTLYVQYRLRRYETRETFFIIRNLVIALLLIELTYLFGTTFHMDLFWIRVAQWSPSSAESTLFHRTKHILCLSVPIFLHFIHLASLFWMLSHSILLYQRFWRMTADNTAVTSNPVMDHKENNQKTLSTNKIQTDHKSCVEQMSSSGQEYRKRYLKRSKSKSNTSKSSRRSRSSRSWCWYLKAKICRLAHILFVNPLKGLFHNSIKMHNLEKSLPNKKCATRQWSDTNELNLNSNLQMSNIFFQMETHHAQHQHHQPQQPSGDCETVERIVRPTGDEKTVCKTLFRAWKCTHYLSLSLGLPFALVLISYLLNPKGYETKR